MGRSVSVREGDQTNKETKEPEKRDHLTTKLVPNKTLDWSHQELLI